MIGRRANSVQAVDLDPLEQAALLTANRFSEVDVLKAAGAIGDVGGSDDWALEGRIKIVLLAILKWFASLNASCSRGSTRLSRNARSFRVKASLPRRLSDACQLSSRETHLRLTTFAEACPCCKQQTLETSYEIEET